MSEGFPFFHRRRLQDFVRNARQPCVAVFDIGTRAARVLVAPRQVPERWYRSSFCSDSRITNIGLDVCLESGRLPLDCPSLLATVDFIKTRTLLLKECGVTEITVIATAWLRWLTNQQEVMAAIYEQTGQRLEVIRQDREAELTLLAVPQILHRSRSNPGIQPGDTVLMMDQGGGSLEISWMPWGVGQVDRPQVEVRPFPELGTVRLRKQFFHHDASGNLTDPLTNSERVPSQIARIQSLGQSELKEAWDGCAGLGEGKLWVYAVGSAITSLLHRSKAGMIQGKRVSLNRMEEGLAKLASKYERHSHPVSSIYRKMMAEDSGTEWYIDVEELDRDLTSFYGLPIYAEALRILQVDALRVLGYPLRFGYYIWKYLMFEPISTVRSCTTDGPYLYLSYAEADKQAAYDLLKTLGSLGVRVAWDEGQGGGEDCPPELLDMIRNASALMGCLSPNSLSLSRFVDQELKFARAQGKEILTLELAEFSLPTELEEALRTVRRLCSYRMTEDQFLAELQEAIPKDCFRSATS